VTESEDIIRRLTRRVVMKTLRASLEDADRVAQQIYAELSNECGGDRLYIGCTRSTQQRNARLLAEYTDVSRQHGHAVAMRVIRLRTGLSARQIQRIVRQRRES